MKLNITYIIALAAILVVTGCRKDFDEINTNPNQPSEVSTAFLLTSAQKQLMDHTSDEWWSGRRGMQLAQFWSSNQYSSESRYQLRSAITNNYWLYFYAGRDGTGQPNGGGMQDLQEIIRLNTEFPDEYSGYGSNANQIAVANILKSWTFGMMTDCWGRIPYSEALQGSDNTSPKYDSQETIYRGILSTLESAANSIQEGANGPQGDIIYGGDMAKWKKFANSLRLRAALRIADRLPDLAADHAASAVAAGVFTSNDDNALFGYLTGVPNNHPINQDFQTRNDFAASNVMVDVLEDLGDPRMGFYYSPSVDDGLFVGEIYGLTEADAALTPNDSISQRSSKILAADFPGIYMDYAQVEFLLAEAVERGYVAGVAADHYNNGITASMNWWNDGSVTAADITAYIASPGVNYATLLADGMTWKEIIGKQKWIALYMQGIEAWTEYRRLDFGILQLPAGGILDPNTTSVPHRFMYPLDEQTLNNASYSEAVQAQGADIQDTPVWWDVE